MTQKRLWRGRLELYLSSIVFNTKVENTLLYNVKGNCK